MLALHEKKKKKRLQDKDDYSCGPWDSISIFF
jgi:hypothetical protein